ncbi:hypothetical protein [Streptomyces sp. bgisy027]|uniref:hypothetical protein n=1 Tax=Streptomyces sp. bgisy027 TaxID=3413770 RepID=UPI003D744828
MILLLGVFYLGLVMAAVFALAVIFDRLPVRRPARTIGQPVQHTAPPLPHATVWAHADLRHTRPGPPGPGRHRRPTA